MIHKYQILKPNLYNSLFLLLELGIIVLNWYNILFLYFRQEYGLYYDGNSGTYLQYNQDTKSYEYHSQIHLDAQEPKFPEKIGKRKIKNEVEGKVR